MRLNCRIAAAVIGLSLSQGACLATNTWPKMYEARPIDIDQGPFASRYKQNGRAIDPSDMRDRLQQRPDSAADVRRAKVLAAVSVILGGLGGALVGWPLGDVAVGKENPSWPLAAIGAATVGVAIPLAVWSDSSLDSAVEKHNRRPQDTPPPAPPQAELPRQSAPDSNGF